MELGGLLRRAVALARDPAVAAAGLFGGIWAALVVLLGGLWASHWVEVLPRAPVPLIGAVVVGVLVHGLAFHWGRRRGWWAVPVAVMAADAATGLLGGGLVAGYALVLTPSLFGLSGLNRVVPDLAPPYSTVLTTAVALWMLVGLGALAGGAAGLGGAVVGFPVQVALWGLLLLITGRRRAETAGTQMMTGMLDGERQAA